MSSGMNDRELLAKMLQAEAGNQGVTGMLAVGAVIDNRRRTSGYGGNTWRDVMLAPGQFSPANSITGYAGGEQGVDLYNLQPSETAYMVADQILGGKYEDPTNGALNFLNPDISQPAWMKTMGNVTRIGDHVFGTAGTGEGITGAPSSMSTRSPVPQMEAPQMEPEKVGGLLGRLFPDMDPDRADRIRMGLNGMLHNPNAGLQRGIEARMGERAQGRERQQAAAQAQQQANLTAQWLASQPGGQRYAQAIASGALPAVEALQMWRQESQGAAEPSAAEAKISRLMETGLSREEAINAADRYVVSRDPMTGDAALVDRATGQQVGKPQEQASPQQTDMPSNLPSVTIGAGDRTDAFGVEGVLKRGANAVADTVGADMPFGDVQNTISDFSVLKESLINDIASAYPRQPPSWLLRNIEELTPKAGTLQGARTAISKLEAIRRNFQNEIAIAQRRAAQPQRPAQQQEVEQQIIGLTAALERVDAAISGFDRPKGRTTSSGITFEVIE